MSPIKLLLLSLFLSINALGQMIRPFHDANAVLVTFTDIGAEAAFQSVIRALVEQGYAVEQADSSFLTLETGVRTLPSRFNRTGTSMIIRAAVRSVAGRKTEVRISGSVGLLGQTPTSAIGYRGAKGSVFMNGFDELQALAEQLTRQDNGTITYSQ